MLRSLLNWAIRHHQTRRSRLPPGMGPAAALLGQDQRLALICHMHDDQTTATNRVSTCCCPAAAPLNPSPGSLRVRPHHLGIPNLRRSYGENIAAQPVSAGSATQPVEKSMFDSPCRGVSNGGWLQPEVRGCCELDPGVFEARAAPGALIQPTMGLFITLRPGNAGGRLPCATLTTPWAKA